MIYAGDMAPWTNQQRRTRPEWLAGVDLSSRSNLSFATPNPPATIGVGRDHAGSRYHLFTSSVDGRINYHKTMQHVIHLVYSPPARGTPMVTTSTSRDEIESICFEVLPSLSSEYEVHCTWLRLIQLPAKLGPDGKTLVKLEATVRVKLEASWRCIWRWVWK